MMSRGKSALLFALVVFTASAASAQSRFDVLHPFVGGEGTAPNAALIRGTDGNFYGTTWLGGAANGGTVYRVTSAGIVTVLHSFVGGAGDGLTAKAPLLQAADGTFYGTTVDGGTANLGTAFKITSSGTFTLLHSFIGFPEEGAHPYAGLIQGADGDLYGTTYNGGSSDRGTIFKMTSAGVITTLYSFVGGADGAHPYAALIQANDGNFYGATYAGDTQGLGRIFRMTPAGVLTPMHIFTSGSDGANPIGGLVQGTDGNLYGTTHFGGASDLGTVYKMTLSGTVTILHSFAGSDGAYPDATLIEGDTGNFFGTATVGGAGFGTVFMMTPSGIVTVLHIFTSGVDGANPSSALIETPEKHFYGTTQAGGSDKGVVYRIRDTTTGGDFDWDTKTDLTVYRPSTGGWFTLRSSTNYTTSSSVSWGASTDRIVPGDYDGDGKADPAVYRPSTGAWHILKSSTNYTTSFGVMWGLSTDLPMQGDYDGDGKADPAIYRPSTGLWR